MAKKVQLNIAKKSRGRGWRPVTATDGKEYWYKFTGGNGRFDNGDQTFRRAGQKQFQVVLKGKPAKKYSLKGFNCFNDPQNQITDCTIAADGKSATITDDCSMQCRDIIYGFDVHPTADVNSVFFCDPRINNEF